MSALSVLPTCTRAITGRGLRHEQRNLRHAVTVRVLERQLPRAVFCVKRRLRLLQRVPHAVFLADVGDSLADASVLRPMAEQIVQVLSNELLQHRR